MHNRIRFGALTSTNSLNKFLAAVLVTAACTSSAIAAPAGSAQPVSVKMGYFNLLQVKASYPEAAAASSLEAKAKEMLQRDLDAANKVLEEMQKANKPKEEIEKKKAELQIQIGATQNAFSQLLSSNNQAANRAIAGAVGTVAKDKGLDLVIDGAGIFAGGEKFISSGEDVTDAIIKKLAPGNQ